jgi:lysylphosphatidylglycerol synthetase-like protein (DUF2156 family)
MDKILKEKALLILVLGASGSVLTLIAYELFKMGGFTKGVLEFVAYPVILAIIMLLTKHFHSLTSLRNFIWVSTGTLFMMAFVHFTYIDQFVNPTNGMPFSYKFLILISVLAISFSVSLLLGFLMKGLRVISQH